MDYLTKITFDAYDKLFLDLKDLVTAQGKEIQELKQAVGRLQGNAKISPSVPSELPDTPDLPDLDVPRPPVGKKR